MIGDNLDFNRLLSKQKELDDYIVKEVGLDVITEMPLIITDTALLNNMVLGLISEAREVDIAPTDQTEWVDVAHFVLSILYRLNITISNDSIRGWLYDDVNRNEAYEASELVEMADDIMDYSIMLVDALGTFKHWKRNREIDVMSVKRLCRQILINVINALYILGYDFNEEYDKKYAINVKRQLDKY